MTKLNIKNLKNFELKTTFDKAKSFYKKAYVYFDDEFYYLQSYNTIVSKINKSKNNYAYNNEMYNTIKIYNASSQTTIRYIREFIRQFLNVSFTSSLENLRVLEFLHDNQKKFIIDKKLYNIYKKKGIDKMRESKNYTLDCVSFIDNDDYDDNYYFMSNSGTLSGVSLDYLRGCVVLTDEEVKEIDKDLVKLVNEYNN